MVVKKRFGKWGATVKRTLNGEIIAAGSETECGGIR